MLGNRARALGALTAITLAVAALMALGAQIVDQLAALRATPSDNVGFVLSQVEVELLKLVREAERPDPADLADLRKLFDIFYSRIKTVEGMDQLRSNRTSPLGGDIDATTAAVDALAPLVDSSDETLRQRRSDLAKALQGLLPRARSIALEGVAAQALVGDGSRRALSNLFVEAGFLALALIAALAALQLILLRQRRISNARSREIESISQRYRKTIDAALDAIIVADANGVILDFNPAAERTFGYSRNAAVGAEMETLIVPPRLREAHRVGMRRNLQTGRTRVLGAGRVTLEGVRANGEEFPIEVSLGASEGADGPLFIAYLRDVSEQVRAQKELTVARDEALAAARAKSQFLAVMSHEMRTPLNGVLATLDLLAATDLEARQRRYVETATASGELLQNHINDVLELSHIEAGQMHLRRSVFPLRALLAEIVEMNAQAAATRGDSLRIASDCIDADIYEDRHRLSQVLVNLVSNAVKFTRNGLIEVGAFRVPGRSAEGALEIYVRDTGVGIAEANQKRIFEDFVSIDGSYRRTTRGYGLGLAICRRIASALEGDIGVESALGEGSRFWIRTPVRKAPARETPACANPTSAAAPSASGPLSVLLVEDNDTNRLVAREMLLSAGCSVAEARDGAEAFDSAARERFDLILMDISMPRVDGLEATRAIRGEAAALSRNAPIVGLTAHALHEERDELFRAGMNECLVKPLRKRNLDKLVARIRSGSLSGQSDLEGRGSAEEDGDAPMIDTGVYRELAEVLPDDLLRQRLAAFRSEIGALGEGFANADGPEAAAKLAHKLAGAAAVFGAEPLRLALGAIEKAWRRNDLADMQGLQTAALGVAARTQKALDGPTFRGVRAKS